MGVDLGPYVATYSHCLCLCADLVLMHTVLVVSWRVDTSYCTHTHTHTHCTVMFVPNIMVCIQMYENVVDTDRKGLMELRQTMTVTLRISMPIKH